MDKERKIDPYSYFKGARDERKQWLNETATCPNGTAPQFLHYYKTATGVCMWCKKAEERWEEGLSEQDEELMANTIRTGAAKTIECPECLKAIGVYTNEYINLDVTLVCDDCLRAIDDEEDSIKDEELH